MVSPNSYTAVSGPTDAPVAWTVLSYTTVAKAGVCMKTKQQKIGSRLLNRFMVVPSFACGNHHMAIRDYLTLE
jgi:hypothetical protein